MRNNRGRTWLVLGLLAALAPMAIAHGASPPSGIVGDTSGAVGNTTLSQPSEKPGLAAGLATAAVGPAAPNAPVVLESSVTQATESTSASGIVGDEFGQLAVEDGPDIAGGIIGR
jgi:hypothetical protein